LNEETTMKKSWYRAYYESIGAQMSNVRVGPGDAMSVRVAEKIAISAGLMADASEAYLTKRGEDEDAADEAKRQAWEKEATEKVLRIGWYSVGGLGGPGDPRIVLTVREVRGGRVYFHDNLRQIESADLADVDMEDGFMPAPIDEPSGSGSGGGGTASPELPGKLAAIKVLWRRPGTLCLYGLPYLMREGQSPYDLWRAHEEWKAPPPGHYGSKRIDLSDWIWLGSPGWWGSYSKADHAAIKAWLDLPHVKPCIPGNPCEWSPLDEPGKEIA
jgi:hypothetical protein